MRIEVVTIDQGEVLWPKNSTCEYALFICSGSFELESPEDVLGKVKLNTGQLVGDFPSIMNEKIKTISSVKCTKSGDILRIRKHLLLDFVSNNPGLFIHIRDKLIVN